MFSDNLEGNFNASRVPGTLDFTRCTRQGVIFLTLAAVGRGYKKDRGASESHLVG